MTAALLGQVLGLSFACGLNLYLTVAALGLLSRFGVIRDLPPGLQGLEGIIVIGSAAALFLIEAVIDKVGHADSVWDIVHTFIRPPAAALLSLGALWGRPVEILAAGAAIAFFVALAAHGTKAGLRISLNTTMSGGHARVSVAEDILALGLAVTAFMNPGVTLIATSALLLALALLGPRYWRAFRLGVRALGAWRRTLFSPARWREEEEMPRRVRALLDPVPIGAAPARGARAALDGLPGPGAYRNGWLVVGHRGAFFVHRTLLGYRRVDLPASRQIHVEPGVWADVLLIEAENDTVYRVYMLKDGPTPDIAIPQLQQAIP